MIAELSAKDSPLRETAWWVAGRHPQWGEHLAGYFRDALKDAPTPELADRLVKFTKNAAVQKLLGDLLLNDRSDAPTLFLLRVMARAGLKAIPRDWKAGVGGNLGNKNPELAAAAFAVLRSIPLTEQDHIDTLAVGWAALNLREGKWTRDQWLLVLASTPPNIARPTAEDLAHALNALDRTSPAAGRTIATDALVRSNLAADQLLTIAAALRDVGPLDLPNLLAVFAKSTDEKVGLALVKSLSDTAVRATLRAEQIKPILDKYPKSVRDEAEKLYALLAEARKGERDKLDKLLAALEPGDVRRGQTVFNGQKGQCAACHKIGYVGGLAGPDLTRIGGIRTERDLLEAIVFPSASFVRSYEPVRVVTADGRVLNGVLKKDAPDEIILSIAADKEERIPRADVESITPSSVSIMPAGLDQQLTTRELADLVAFLKACK